MFFSKKILFFIPKGDSGGPLMYKIGNRWATIGIVSWGSSHLINFFLSHIKLSKVSFYYFILGPESCDGERPGVYGGVHFYMDWVKEKLKFRGYCLLSLLG